MLKNDMNYNFSRLTKLGLPILLIITVIYIYTKTCSHNRLYTLMRSKNTVHKQSVCTNEVLQFYINQYKRFPGEGSWDDNLHTFYPQLCKIVPADLGRCFARKQTRRIVIFGDSNGGRYLDGLMEIWTKNKVICRKVHGERFDENYPEGEYFSLGDKDLESLMAIHKRGCRTCGSAAFSCSRKDWRHPVHIEYIAVYSFSDNSISLNQTLIEKQSKYPEAHTFLEFLFRVYFKDFYPDLLFLFAPFNHDKMNGNVSFIRSQMYNAFNLLQNTPEYKGDTYWLTTPAESEEKMPKWWQNRTYEGMTPNEKIHLLNYVMHNTLQAELVKSSTRTYGYFDFFAMTQGNPDLKYDGVHLTRKWYSFTMDSLLNVFCNSH